jgi:formylglycine-generating enzyme required for sulfatase activity
VTGNNPSFFQSPSRPVERVSWNRAHAFAQRLSAMTGRKFRLPTEAELRYAAQDLWGIVNWKGQASPQPGIDAESLLETGWYQENSGGQTHPVAQKTPNRFGVHDLGGNVWEWCADWCWEGGGRPESTRPRWGANWSACDW